MPAPFPRSPHPLGDLTHPHQALDGSPGTWMAPLWMTRRQQLLCSAQQLDADAGVPRLMPRARHLSATVGGLRVRRDAAEHQM